MRGGRKGKERELCEVVLQSKFGTRGGKEKVTFDATLGGAGRLFLRGRKKRGKK